MKWRNLSIAKIDKILSPEHLNYEVRYTKKAGDATQITEKAITEEFDTIVVVGGDGSLNEVARVLVNSSVVLGIIPLGSGNGFARSLKIPILTSQALRNIVYGNVKKIDVGYVNNKPFFSTCGFGFDGIVSHDFENLKGRGYFTYVKSMLRTYFKYRSSNYTIQYNDHEKKVKALSVIFANANQLGYNIKISKKAEMDNGLLELCIMKNVPKWKGVISGIMFGMNQLERVKTFSVEKIIGATIIIEQPEFWHIDGEAQRLTDKAMIRVEKQALQVLVPG